MMAEDIIVVENLSKLYRLGEINTGSLSHDLNRWWSKLKGNDDPYAKFAETNDRSTKGSSGYVWSLKDINFSVKQGEVFGIIGKNGAGKSTLLKLLSKITKPTKGCIKIGGTVASLLEVGTGFHPDLSGRENIFLNGAILGMSKQEIKNRFDEIVDFSGIERYIDTPVKRYSSGMFVRLAFAVAAHLEPEILIIDEVLAVGDAEFQQKCLGKMKEVSEQQGRTVLFVSHNLSAVKRLCTSAMLLDKGSCKMIGPVENVLESYQESEKDVEHGKRNKLPDDSNGYFTEWKLEGQDSSDNHTCYSHEELRIVFYFRTLTELPKSEFQMGIRYQEEMILFHASSMDFSGKHFTLHPGLYKFMLHVELPLREGKYEVEAGLNTDGKWVDIWRSSTKLQVLDTFDAHLNDNPFKAILNLKTKFSLEGLGQIVQLK